MLSIMGLNPFHYYGIRCWFSHVVLRQQVDFYDVECMNCSVPIGAAEIHEEYPLVICSMCEEYTTVEKVTKEWEDTGYKRRRRVLGLFMPSMSLKWNTPNSFRVISFTKGETLGYMLITLALGIALGFVSTMVLIASI